MPLSQGLPFLKSPKKHSTAPKRSAKSAPEKSGAEKAGTDKVGTKEPLLLRACRGEKLDRPPVWMMRQAGRYLSEYHDVRNQTSFLGLCKTPDLAVEVSLQPWRRFGLDAVIVFSDILIPLEAMGMTLVFEEGVGPRFPHPLKSPVDLKTLKPFDPLSETGFLMTALQTLRHELANSPETALIGFAGAPWTLATYMIEGESWKSGQHVYQWLYHDPKALHQLLQMLADMLIPYLSAQIDAGAHVVQLFDTWAGMVPTEQYREFVLPYQKQVIDGVRALHPETPILLFVKRSRGLLPLVLEAGPDVVSLDEMTPLPEARKILGRNVVIQGNLDSYALLMETPDALQHRVEKMLADGGRQNYIFNLGHGVLPKTPVENVARVVETVKNRGRRPVESLNWQA